MSETFGIGIIADVLRQLKDQSQPLGLRVRQSLDSFCRSGLAALRAERLCLSGTNRYPRLRLDLFPEAEPHQPEG
jgi:hypothetical protein